MKINLTKDINTIYQEIETNGYSTIPLAIPEEELNTIKNYVESLLTKQSSTFSVAGNENLKNSPLGKLYCLDSFNELQKQLVNLKLSSHKLKTDMFDDDKYQVLRVLNGGDVNAQSHLYHFDNYTLTTLLPIFIPSHSQEKNGDLLFIPNNRSMSDSPNKDAIIKLITQNPITRRLLKLQFIRDKMGFQALKLLPGNLYLFWGFCSYHGNDNCCANSLRSTALFHYHKTVKNTGLFSSLVKTKKRSRIKG